MSSSKVKVAMKFGAEAAEHKKLYERKICQTKLFTYFFFHPPFINADEYSIALIHRQINQET